MTHTLPLPSTTTSTTTTEIPPPTEPRFGRLPVNEPIISPIRERHFRQPLFKEEKLEPVFLDVDADGVFKYEMTIPENVGRAFLEAVYEKSSAYLRPLYPNKSPSNSFMQVTLLNPQVKPKTGSVSTFEIKTTEHTPKVYYQVISKGQVEVSGEIDMPTSGVKKFNLSIETEMAPKARLIVHYVREDGEIVTDALTFNIDGIFKNKVDINFDVQTTRPGNEVVVSVKADPDSTVHLLTVDNSVLILRSDNDVKESRVNDELNSYDNAFSGGNWRPSGGWDAEEMFRNNGILVLTDALVYNYVEPRGPSIYTFSQAPAVTANYSMGSVQSLDFMPEQEIQEDTGMFLQSMGVPRDSSNLPVRKLFPETWLWSNASVGPDGMTSLSVPVPDTITTWVATAFAVNPNSGLGLTPSPANVLVTIDENKSFKNLVTYIQGNQVRKGRFSARVGRTFNMSAGEIYPVYFPIIPTKTGDLKINITVISTGPSDAVIRYLKVEPEGVEKEFNNPVLINTGTTGTFTDNVAVDFPPNTVAGSRCVRASVIGDVMGPSISGLDSLLKMPYGCGEQNMLNFAPNIFVQKYLKITSNLTPDLEMKAKEYMIKGYQREMTYSHDDGSYSAFGKSDKSGTTWLTAFVVKSFSQATVFITIDENVVKKAVTWLISQQNENGTFREPGRVLNKKMQGGSAGGERALTAFTLIALKEAEVIPGVSELTRRAIQKASTYLEDDIDLLDDIYEIALVGYALQITNCPRVSEVIDKLNTKATVKGMDTIIALQGLAEFSTMVYSSNLNMKDIEITNMRVTLTSKTPGAPFNQKFTITQDSTLVLQTADIPVGVKRLEVKGEGSGIALAEISTYFNTDEEIEVSSFDVNVTLTDENTKGFTVKVCGRWLKEGNSGMSMMDIGIPSGMTPDLDTLNTSKAPMFKRIEMGYRKLSLYFDEFDRRAQCASVYIANTDKVAEKQPSVIKLYDYYEPKNQATTFYTSRVLADSGVCDVCGTECFCTTKP